jgi:hypothetical protein
MPHKVHNSSLIITLSFNSKAANGQTETQPPHLIHFSLSIFQDIKSTYLNYGIILSLVLGNRLASLIFVNFSKLIVNLSKPIDHPAWGGIPYLKAFR